jgi:hypothetical protein
MALAQLERVGMPRLGHRNRDLEFLSATNWKGLSLPVDAVDALEPGKRILASRERDVSDSSFKKIYLRKTS